MPKIRIVRQPGFYGMFRSLVIVVDGVTVGRITQGREIVVEVPAGSREIWGEMDWGKTPRLSLENHSPACAVVFKGYFTFNFISGVGITPLPFLIFFDPEPTRSPL